MKQATWRVGNARLLRLANFLDIVPRKQFDYAVIVGENWKGKSDLSCGTQACAMGWAGSMPFFRRLGLRLYEDGVGGNVGLFENGRLVLDDMTAIGMVVFGLEEEETYALFNVYVDQPERTPTQVAQKIRAFVKKRGNKEFDDDAD